MFQPAGTESTSTKETYSLQLLRVENNLRSLENSLKTMQDEGLAFNLGNLADQVAEIQEGVKANYEQGGELPNIQEHGTSLSDQLTEADRIAEITDQLLQHEKQHR